MNDTTPPASGQKEQTSLHEKITDSARIRGVLNGLRSTRALLSARTPHRQHYFNTTLLKLDLDGGWIYLDELSPREGHDQLSVGDVLHIYGVFNGVPAHFACTIEHIGEQNNIAFYRAPLPDTMDYQQRRAYFRAYVGMGMEVSLQLRLADGEQVKGRVQDISLGGFAAFLPADCPVQAIDEITVEDLRLSGRTSITGTAQVRHTHPGQNQVLAGFMFTELDPRAQRELLRVILDLEREQIRKQTKS
jgi:flagellar brake protein